MDLLTGMEFDLFVPSFPNLQSQFNLSALLVEALLAVNFFGYCLSLFLVGSLADRYGRKPVILMGLILFVFGSLFSLKESYTSLLIGRFFQGVGIAAPAILSFLIIADSYPLKKQQYWMAMLNGVMNISVAIAPVIGSYVTLYFDWQGNFIVLLILGLIALLMTLFFIPSIQLTKSQETFSFHGYLSLFKSKPLMLLMINIIFMFIPYWIFVGISPLLYMKNFGVGLTHFGYYQGILALVFALGSFLFGILMQQYETMKMLHTASVIYVVSLISIVSITWLNSMNPLWVTLAFIPFIISQIIPSNLLIPVCLNFFPPAKARISAVLQGSRLIFAALSLELTGYLYQESFRNIGLIICVFIMLIIITHFMVINNNVLLKAIHKD